ncbi:hypothetical protein J2T14_000016 [Paenibacillus harenae]|nr:hypothetical protein [Paenibacillus harenae]
MIKPFGSVFYGKIPEDLLLLTDRDRDYLMRNIAHNTTAEA